MEAVGIGALIAGVLALAGMIVRALPESDRKVRRARVAKRWARAASGLERKAEKGGPRAELYAAEAAALRQAAQNLVLTDDVGAYDDQL